MEFIGVFWIILICCYIYSTYDFFTNLEAWPVSRGVLHWLGVLITAFGSLVHWGVL